MSTEASKMAKRERIYQCSETGRKALESQNSGLPAAYRDILGLIHGTTHSDDVLSGMRGHADRQVRDWLDELETLCFVESSPFASEQERSGAARK